MCPKLFADFLTAVFICQIYTTIISNKFDETKKLTRKITEN